MLLHRPGDRKGFGTCRFNEVESLNRDCHENREHGMAFTYEYS